MSPSSAALLISKIFRFEMDSFDGGEHLKKFCLLSFYDERWIDSYNGKKNFGVLLSFQLIFLLLTLSPFS